MAICKRIIIMKTPARLVGGDAWLKKGFIYQRAPALQLPERWK